METTAQQHSHLSHIQPDHMQQHHPSHDVHMHLHNIHLHLYDNKHILQLGIHSQLQDSDIIMGNMKNKNRENSSLKAESF